MEERIFKPGVYRHFKENKPLKERLYYGIAQTYDIPKKENLINSFCAVKRFKAQHTETGQIIEVVLTTDGVFRTNAGESFVFYKALYGDEKYYVRPIEMFLSPRDTEKYPEFSQYWRMEKIG